MKKFSSFIEHQVNEEQLDEKNVPTSPEKWARAKAAAKAKFAVYPSAYANGWASKKYKAMGGGWKSVGEEVEHIEEVYDVEHMRYINTKEGDKHFEDGHATMMKHIGDDFLKDNVRTHAKHAFKQNPHKKGTKEHKAWQHGADAARDEHIGGLHEAAKWRSTSVAKKVTDPDDYHDSASYDYHHDNPKSTGMKKATSDTPEKYGSLSSRLNAQVASKGVRKGMITKQHAERLKSRIKSGMNNEEVEHIEEGEGIVTPKKMVGEPTPGSYAYERKYGKYTAKGTLRKRPNPNKPPVAEPVKEELEESHVAIAMGKELDDEGSMAMNQLDTITRACEMLRKEIKDPEMQLPGWVQSKLTLAADYMETVAGYMASKNEKVSEEVEQIEEATPAWQRKEGKDPKGGLNRKGIASYRRENPGSKLSMAVTTKPSKLKPGSKAANRRKSFCARMGGMKKRLTSAKTARDPDSRINKALRKWNC